MTRLQQDIQKKRCVRDLHEIPIDLVKNTSRCLELAATQVLRIGDFKVGMCHGHQVWIAQFSYMTGLLCDTDMK